MDENKPRRRWLSFGIRDLLWAMALVGMGLGWWAEYRYDRGRAAALEAIAQEIEFAMDVAPAVITSEGKYPGPGMIRVVLKYPDGTEVKFVAEVPATHN